MSIRRDTDGVAASAGSERASLAGDATTTTAPLETVVERDTLFHVLGNERRRRTLRYLLAADEELVPLCTLADVVAAAECVTTVDALRYTERQRVYISLYQSHLPQMAEAGIVEFDREDGLVATTPHTRTVEPFLERDRHPEREFARWLWPVFAGTGIGIAFMLVVVEGLGPVRTVALTVLVALVALGVETARSRFDVGPRRRPPTSR